MARTCSMLVVAVLVATILAMADAQAEAEWLAAHNSARSAVGVAPLTWNAAAAAYALGWAQTQAAKAGCPLMHSPKPRPASYGENIAKSSLSSSTPTTVVRDQWVGEEKEAYDYASNSCSLGVGECGHYTQVVWAKTTSVGCASATCSEGSFVFYICSYFPAGNVNGEWPY